MAQRPKTRATGPAKPPRKTKPATKQATKGSTKARAAAAATDDAKRKPAGVKISSTAAKTPKKTAAASTTAAKKSGATTKTPAKGPVAKTDKAKKTDKAATRHAAASPKTSKQRAAAKSAGSKGISRTTKKTAKAPKPLTPPQPAYLAAELGQPVDYEGEPIGAGSAALRSDKDLQDYTLQLWRQMQSGGVVNRYMRAIERAGLTIDEVWTAGVTETRSTSSTADEMRRYREKLLFRANLLEAILSETVADLHRLDGIEPGDATTKDVAPADGPAGEVAAPAGSA